LRVDGRGVDKRAKTSVGSPFPLTPDFLTLSFLFINIPGLFRNKNYQFSALSRQPYAATRELLSCSAKRAPDF
jgi:hypothetical protein